MSFQHKTYTRYADAAAFVRSLNATKIGQVGVLTAISFERYHNKKNTGLTYFAVPVAIAITPVNIKAKMVHTAHVFTGEVMRAIKDLPQDLNVIVYDYNLTIQALIHCGFDPSRYNIDDVRQIQALIIAGKLERPDKFGCDVDEEESEYAVKKKNLLSFAGIVDELFTGKFPGVDFSAVDLPPVTAGALSPDLAKRIAAQASVLPYAAYHLLRRLHERGQQRFYEQSIKPGQLMLWEIMQLGLSISREQFSVIEADLRGQITALTEELSAEPYGLRNVYDKSEVENISDRLRGQSLEAAVTFDEKAHSLLRFKSALSSFFDHPEYIDVLDRIHPVHNRDTSSGRASCTDPSFGNITKACRHVAQAPKGYCLIETDLSNVEVRVASVVNDDQVLQKDCAEGDIYCGIVRRVYQHTSEMSDEEIREKHEDLRGKAKVILLGKIYGQTDKGLAARLNITPDEAEKISGFLSKRYVRLFENIFKKLKDAQVRWFVRTDAGHLRVLPDGASFYSSKTQNCIRNYNIQAAAAGTFFKAALRIHQHLKDFFTPDNRIVFLLHDSVLVEAAEADVERIRTVVETILVKAYEQDFPGVGFKVKSCVTKSWGEELYTTKGSI